MAKNKRASAPREMPCPVLDASIRTRGEALDLLEECSGLLWAVHDCKQFGVPLPELLLYDLAGTIAELVDFLREPAPFELQSSDADRARNAPVIDAAARKLTRLLVEANANDDSMPETPDGLGAYINGASIPALEKLAARLSQEAA